MGTSLNDSIFRDPSKALTQLSSDVALDASLGAVMGIAGGLPKTNHKIIWSAPTKHNPLGFRLVSPTLQEDMRKLRGTLADSTGGAIYQNMGGELHFSNGTKLKMPEAASLKPKEALDWIDKYGANIEQYINKNVSLRAQAKQAAEIQEAILKIGTTAVNDGNAQTLFSVHLQPRNFDDLIREAKRQRDYSGDALYQKVIDLAKDRVNSSRPACFIADTLIKLPKGWKKIQDIEVGDIVLSRPENGMGEAIPKKVINTFCFQDKPVWHVWSGSLEQVGEILGDSQQIVTFDHPYCVYGYIKDDKLISYEDRDPVFFDVPIWKSVNELETGDLIKNYDDELYAVLTIRPVYKTSQENIVWLPGSTNLEKHIHRSYVSKEWWRFTADGEAYEINYKGGLERVWDIENNDDMIIDVTERPDISEYAEEYHYLPYTTNVYNFEVEDYHTYFVSYSSVLVHNTGCGESIQEKILKLAENNGKIKVVDTINKLGIRVKVVGKKAAISSAEKMSVDELKGLILLVDESFKIPKTLKVLYKKGTPAKTQADAYGSVVRTDANGDDYLLAYTVGFPNPKTGGEKLIAMGDAILYVDVDGTRQLSNTLLDLKQGALGYHTKAMYDYISQFRVEHNQAELDEVNKILNPTKSDLAKKQD